jgi:hypothetical protein
VLVVCCREFTNSCADMAASMYMIRCARKRFMGNKIYKLLWAACFLVSSTLCTDQRHCIPMVHYNCSRGCKFQLKS